MTTFPRLPQDADEREAVFAWNTDWSNCSALHPEKRDGGLQYRCTRLVDHDGDHVGAWGPREEHAGQIAARWPRTETRCNDCGLPMKWSRSHDTWQGCMQELRAALRRTEHHFAGAVARILDNRAISKEPERPKPFVTVRSIGMLAANASTALGLVSADLPVDESIVRGLEDGVVLCEAILFGVQAETSNTFSVRSLEAQHIVRLLRRLPDGEKRIGLAGAMREALQAAKRGVSSDAARNYFFEYCMQIPLLFRERRSL